MEELRASESESNRQNDSDSASANHSQLQLNGKTTFTEAELAEYDDEVDEEAEVEAQRDTPDVPVRFSEKKRLHWRGLTCSFSPLQHLYLGLI